jgi:hypothetical protein
VRREKERSEERGEKRRRKRKKREEERCSLSKSLVNTDSLVNQ